MLIEIIKQAPEETLLHWVEQGAGHHDSAVLFRLCEEPPRQGEDELPKLLQPVIADWHGKIYYLRNGDIAVTWSGAQKTVIDRVIATLYAGCGIDPQRNLAEYFDRYAHAEALRLLCQKHLALQATILRANDAHHAKGRLTFEPSQEQVHQLKEASIVRTARKTPEILLVEDQAFSRKLLRQVLEHTYKVHDAATAEEGFNLHFKHAPDISFLDVDLPDGSGHDLAAALRRYDAKSFVVMVTANNYNEDVQRALTNGAQGFIAKPYNKRKIIEAIQKFHAAQEKK